MFDQYEIKIGALPDNLSFNQSTDYILINCEISQRGKNGAN